MLAGRIVAISSLEELPAEATHDREVCRQLGIKSNLTIPLSVGGGRPFGILGLNTTLAEREWPDVLVKRLQLLAQIFANALARKRSDEILRQSEERLSLAAEAAGAGLWSLDLGTGVFWLTAKTRELFGYSAGAVVTLGDFMKLVHPEDQSAVRHAVRTLVVSRKEDQVEYRVLLRDGSVHWMLSRCRAHVAGPGKPAQITGVSIRITDRKRLEESFRASEARLQAGSDLAGLGYYEVDYGAGPASWITAFGQICGVPAEVQAGPRSGAVLAGTVHPDDRQLVQDERQKLHDGNVDRIGIEYRYLHPALGQRWLHHVARVAARDRTGRSAPLLWCGSRHY